MHEWVATKKHNFSEVFIIETLLGYYTEMSALYLTFYNLHSENLDGF